MASSNFFSCYRPISPGSIRLLRLFPDENENAPIRCELIHYSIQRPRKRRHPYDALSYTWGEIKNPKSIYVSGYEMPVTRNLHSALLQMRHDLIERILWIDAICINQADEREKENQIQLMASIYGQANRVLVWLGEAADDSDLAMKYIHVAGQQLALKPSMDRHYLGPIEEEETTSESMKEAILLLMERRWFRRIWILQEVAAARQVSIQCGCFEMDGYAFCLGMEALITVYEARPDLQRLIHSATHLIKGAIFRPQQAATDDETAIYGKSSLGMLIDMYRGHEATRRHDKVYALLGMSSNDSSRARDDLLPDYQLPWAELLKRVTKSLLHESINVETFFKQKDTAIVRSKGCIFGCILHDPQEVASNNTLMLNIQLTNEWSQLNGMETYMSVQWSVRPSANGILSGDIICLLEGAKSPSIIRPCDDHFLVIAIATQPLFSTKVHPSDLSWEEQLKQFEKFPRDLSLVWQWDNFLECQHLPEEEDHRDAAFTQSLTIPELELEKTLSKLTRVWDVGLVLGDMPEYNYGKKAIDKIQEAIEKYRKFFGIEAKDILDAQSGLTPLIWAAGNGYEDIVRLLLSVHGVDPSIRNNRNHQSALSVAAAYGHDTIVGLLLQTGKMEVNVKDNEGQTPFALAVQSGHLNVVTQLLRLEEVDLDVKDEQGRTLLCLAASEGHDAIIELILQLRLDQITMKSGKGLTPLHYAVIHGHQSTVELLLRENHINIDDRDKEGCTPLWHATYNGYESIVDILLKTSNVDVNAKDERGHTPFWNVVAWGRNKSMAQFMLENHKVEINASDAFCGTPLSWAARRGDLEMVKLLLETRRVDIDYKPSTGKTPFWWTVQSGNLDIVKLLLENNDLGEVDVDPRDSNNKTALSVAAAEGHLEIVKLLLSTGKVDVNSKDTRKQTPLSYAASKGYVEIVKCLLECKLIDINASDIFHRTPLTWAARQPSQLEKDRENYECIFELLLATGMAEINIRDIKGNTPLLWATKNGSERSVEFLLSTGRVEIETQDLEGHTALSWAASNGETAMVKLFAHTSGVNLNSRHLSPLYWAAKAGQESVVRLLLEIDKVDANCRGNNDETPLFAAVERGHEDVVQLLLDSGKVDINAKIPHEHTTLFCAARLGHDKIVQMLLDAGKAEINSRNKEGQTALFLAAGEGHTAVVEQLLEKGKADADAVDIQGRTPLSYATELRRDDVVKLLRSFTEARYEIKALMPVK